MGKAKKGLRTVFNRETILYVVFGVLTTAINIGLCGLMTQVLHWDTVLSNVLGWIVSVLFAFVTNKILVFRIWVLPNILTVRKCVKAPEYTMPVGTPVNAHGF